MGNHSMVSGDSTCVYIINTHIHDMHCCIYIYVCVDTAHVLHAIQYYMYIIRICAMYIYICICIINEMYAHMYSIRFVTAAYFWPGTTCHVQHARGPKPGPRCQPTCKLQQKTKGEKTPKIRLRWLSMVKLANFVIFPKEVEIRVHCDALTYFPSFFDIFRVSSCGQLAFWYFCSSFRSPQSPRPRPGLDISGWMEIKMDSW